MLINRCGRLKSLVSLCCGNLAKLGRLKVMQPAISAGETKKWLGQEGSMPRSIRELAAWLEAKLGLLLSFTLNCNQVQATSMEPEP